MTSPRESGDSEGSRTEKRMSPNTSEETKGGSNSFAPLTPSKKPVDLNARSVNLLLEQIFLLSLREDAAAPLKFIQSGDETLLNSRNLSEVVMMYLYGGEETAGAVSYLLGCYRRLVQRETSVSEKIRDEFNRFDLLSFVLI